MSEFGSINTSLTGLLAAREALDTTGQNVANANSPGYTRETVQQETVGGSVIPARYATSDGVGQGTAIVGITRSADGFLDLRSLTEHATDSNLKQTQAILNQVETGLNEPGTSGLSAQLSSFWSAWDNLANNPSDSGTRAALLGSAANVAATFNQIAQNVLSIRASSSSQALLDVRTVNDNAAEIASLNQAIASSVAAGLHPNSLIDQRQQVILALGSVIGATTRDGPNGTVDVYVGANALVRGATAGTVSASTTPAGNVNLTWDIDHSTVHAGGEMGALVSAVNTTLPNLLSGPGGLDGIVASVAAAANSAQASGLYWTQNTGVSPPTWSSSSGPPLFSDVSAGPVTAAGMCVNPTLNGAQLAASAPPPNGGPNDGSNAQLTAELANQPNGPDSSYRAYLGDVGSLAAKVNNQVTVQTQITQQVDTARSSAEGVNLDEEMTHMVQYQQAYTASARFLTAVDQTIQTLLNVVQ